MEWAVLSCVLFASCLSIQAEPAVGSGQDNKSNNPAPAAVFNSGTPEREGVLLQLKDYMDQGDALLKDRMTKSYTNLKELLKEGDSVLKDQLVESVAQVKEQRKEGDERLKEELDEDVAWLKDKLAKGQTRMKEDLAEEEAKMKEELAEQREALGRLKDSDERQSHSGGAVADADLQQQMADFRAELQSTQESLQTTHESLQSTQESLQSTQADLHTTQEKVNSMEQELQRTREQLQSEVQTTTALTTQLQTAEDEILSLKVRVNSSESCCQSLLESSQMNSSAVARKVSCDDGYEPACNRCLKAVDREVNYNTAKRGCRQMQGQLAEPKSFEDVHCIWNFRENKGFSYTWVGADDMQEPGVFRWNDGTLLPDDSPMWWNGNGEQEPDKHNPGTTCVYFNPRSSGLWDEACRNSYRYICEKDGI